MAGCHDVERMRELSKKGNAARSAKYKGTEEIKKWCRKGGNANLEKHSREYFVELGRRGGFAGGRRSAITKEQHRRQGPQFGKMTLDQERNLGRKAINPIDEAE